MKNSLPPAFPVNLVDNSPLSESIDPQNGPEIVTSSQKTSFPFQVDESRNQISDSMKLNEESEYPGFRQNDRVSTDSPCFLLGNDLLKKSIKGVRDQVENSSDEETQDECELLPRAQKFSEVSFGFENHGSCFPDQSARDKQLGNEGDQLFSPSLLKYTNTIGTKGRARRDLLAYISEKKARDTQSKVSTADGTELLNENQLKIGQQHKFEGYFGDQQPTIETNQEEEQGEILQNQLFPHQPQEHIHDKALQVGQVEEDESEAHGFPLLHYTKDFTLKRKARDDIFAFIQEKKTRKYSESDQVVDIDSEKDFVPLIAYTKECWSQKRAHEDILAFVAEKRKSKVLQVQENPFEEPPKRELDLNLNLNINKSAAIPEKKTVLMKSRSTEKYPAIEKIDLTLIGEPKKYFSRRDLSASIRPKNSNVLPLVKSKPQLPPLFSKNFGGLSQVQLSGIFSSNSQLSLPFISRTSAARSPKNRNALVLKTTVFDLPQLPITFTEPTHRPEHTNASEGCRLSSPKARHPGRLSVVLDGKRLRNSSNDQIPLHVPKCLESIELFKHSPINISPVGNKTTGNETDSALDENPKLMRERKQHKKQYSLSNLFNKGEKQRNLTVEGQKEGKVCTVSVTGLNSRKIAGFGLSGAKVTPLKCSLGENTPLKNLAKFA